MFMMGVMKERQRIIKIIKSVIGAIDENDSRHTAKVALNFLLVKFEEDARRKVHHKQERIRQTHSVDWGEHETK